VELSQRGDFLHDEATIETTDGTYIYSLPDNFKNIAKVKVDSEAGLLDYWNEYKYWLYMNGNEADTGLPTNYTLIKGFLEGEQQNRWFLYLYPAPDDNDGDNYTVRAFYSAYHPRKITVGDTEYDACDYILFSEEYEPLLKNLLLARWAADKQLDDDAYKYNLQFERQLLQYQPKQWRRVEYRDI